MKCLLLLCFAVASARAGIFGWGDPDWNGLRITFGLSPETLPRTVADALKQGWKLDKQCAESNGFLGHRYIQNGDTAAMILFDDAGYIAGLQAGVKKGQPNGFPAGSLKTTFLEESDKFTVTAYFVQTDKICNGGRTKAEYDDQGTGDRLLIQNGQTPKSLITIPMKESNVTAPWTTGKCFIGMGQHYWYNLSKDMDCNDSKPLFLLYNKGQLNAFGWAMFADLSSKRYEQPPSNIFQRFMVDPPTCLFNDVGTISTMHVYMTNSPLLNFC